MPLFVFLPTDAVMWLLAAGLLLAVFSARRSPRARQRWGEVFSGRTAQACAVVLAFFLAIALADSVHFRARLPAQGAGGPVYAAAAESLLDHSLGSWIASRERSYSSPFSSREFDRSSDPASGSVRRFRQPLRGVTPRAFSGSGRRADLLRRGACGLLAGALLGGLVLLIPAAVSARRRKSSLAQAARALLGSRGGFIAASALLLAGSALVLAFWGGYHPLGTDRTGNDVLYQALKSLRTAFALGTLATLAMLPFALVLGIAAGYFKGWVDDLVQYVYTTISSIPSVLLIAACVLMIQVFIDRRPDLLPTSLERADAKLLFIAVIIGVTSWAPLARLLRAETLKLSGLDFITASVACGTPAWKIMARHLLPNVLHIVLIVSVIGFSDIVLYEAVLSYIGVGVDPSMNSFGSMINAARSEMSRTPAVWWNLAAAFMFMVAIVLSANLLASAVRDAFDPRTAKGGRR